MPHTAGLAESRSPSRGPGLSAEHFQTGAPGSAGGLGARTRLSGSVPPADESDTELRIG